MLDRIAKGNIPPKHHVKHPNPQGGLFWEECLTRRGFDGPYSILYHQHPPHQHRSQNTKHGWPAPQLAKSHALRKHHIRTQNMRTNAGSPVNGRRPLVFNEDVVVSVLRPSDPDPVYVSNVDGDELIFILQGSGLMRSPFGDLSFKQHDYVWVPKGILYRLIPDSGPQYWLSIECSGGVNIPQQWRNDSGQLRMNAPYCHRDFKRPEFTGPLDEGIRDLVVKRGGQFAGFELPESPLDVVGWDGSVYPIVFPIHCFQPRVGQIHLPPDAHGTFSTRGALICSFVPRKVDFHDQAIPCPYPHSSVDCDELLFYCTGDFTSRKGVGPGSLSIHPAGIPHGPHPGAYANSVGTQDTEELAVMIDTFRPLHFTEEALGLEDLDYMESFLSSPKPVLETAPIPA
jgi:homogentisate 1,2-dioxygenase